MVIRKAPAVNQVKLSEASQKELANIINNFTDFKDLVKFYDSHKSEIASYNGFWDDVYTKLGVRGKQYYDQATGFDPLHSKVDNWMNAYYIRYVQETMDYMKNNGLRNDFVNPKVYDLINDKKHYESTFNKADTGTFEGSHQSNYFTIESNLENYKTLSEAKFKNLVDTQNRLVPKLEQKLNQKDYEGALDIYNDLKEVGSDVRRFDTQLNELKTTQETFEKESTELKKEYEQLRSELTNDFSGGKIVSQEKYDRAKQLYEQLNNKKVYGESLILNALPDIPQNYLGAGEDIGTTYIPEDVRNKETSYLEAYNQIQQALTAGETPSAELIATAKSMYPDLIAAGIDVPAVPEATTGYKNVIGEQLESLGMTPERAASYREELTKVPELEQMSPEYANYIRETLSSIDRSTQKTVQQIETASAKAGLSPYAQRAVTQAVQEGGYTKALTGAELKLQDLQNRMNQLAQRETERRSFLSSEYQNIQNANLQLAQLMQQREWETEDAYKQRMQYLEDQLRSRGWQKEDIQNLQEYSTRQDLLNYALQQSQRSQERAWQVSDVESARDYQTYQLGVQRQQTLQDYALQRQQALEDYERQKRDYWQLLEASKPEKQQWWQPILGGVATAAGYALGGGIGGLVTGGVSSLFKTQQPTNYLPNSLSLYPSSGYNYFPSYSTMYPSYNNMLKINK